MVFPKCNKVNVSNKNKTKIPKIVTTTNMIFDETSSESSSIESISYNRMQDNSSEGTIENQNTDRQCSVTTLSLNIPNFSYLRSQVFSIPSYLHDLQWYIVCEPILNLAIPPPNRTFGFYLYCNLGNSLLHCNVYAELHLVSFNQEHPSFSRTFQSVFNQELHTCGFDTFITPELLYNLDQPYMTNDAISLEVLLIAEEPYNVVASIVNEISSRPYTRLRAKTETKRSTPPPVPLTDCSDNVKKDFKSQIFVGLKNQGATCYMNLILQILFFTNQLRTAIYSIASVSDGNKSVILELQRVFYELQTSNRPVCTRKLTESLGWTKLDSFIQNDAHEFVRLFMDNLETLMKQTCAEGIIPELFKGTICCYVKCKNIDYKSTRIETFYDIQLNIKGNKNIEESFNDYIKPETLEGDNKYDTEIHGFQDAEKGVIFKSLPPVLYLHLMRAQYDSKKKQYIKINDRFEFEDEINLDKYLEVKDNHPANYKLFAVMVHSGNHIGGHYTIFINAQIYGQWYSFNDERVTKVSKAQAIEENYGGPRNNKSAYMLIYVRESDIPNVLADVTINHIPNALIQRFKEEKQIKKKKFGAKKNSPVLKQKELSKRKMAEEDNIAKIKPLKSEDIEEVQLVPDTQTSKADEFEYFDNILPVLPPYPEHLRRRRAPTPVTLTNTPVDQCSFFDYLQIEGPSESKSKTPDIITTKLNPTDLYAAGSSKQFSNNYEVNSSSTINDPNYQKTLSLIEQLRKEDEYSLTQSELLDISSNVSTSKEDWESDTFILPYSHNVRRNLNAALSQAFLNQFYLSDSENSIDISFRQNHNNSNNNNNNFIMETDGSPQPKPLGQQPQQPPEPAPLSQQQLPLLTTNKVNLPVVLNTQQIQTKIIDSSEQAVEAMDTQESDMITDQPDIDNLSNNGDAQMQIAPPQIDSTTTAISMDATSTSEVTSTTAGNCGAEEEIRSEATFSFTVENFSKLKESVLSPPCYVRNLPWKIMVMPRSDRNQPDTKSLGFFLQCNGDSESSSWSCNAIAELRLKSFKQGQEPFIRKIKHLFYSKENDWGFSYFMCWTEIFDPEKGYVQNDTVILEVHVVAEAPHGVFWDSKKHTGYVGLKNQGATCYMNSLLQTLFFTNYLRKAVYKMPTEADDSSKSVALALQRVFHELQISDKPVGTKKLTKSFGWETLDSFMQHDVQEFLRVLLDKLESKMKGTCVEGTIPSLFEGKMSSYIKCKNIDYKSTRIETFYDIQLNIKGKKNIEESFNDYIKPETLEGDNKYDAGIHGFQEAEKGVIFKSFPPVLHLHLMRFQYDPVMDNSVKFNDRFEFYETISLDKYLAEKENTPADYKLHAVLVHSGDNHGGHYVVYINPKADGKWCKFDDDVVSSCSKIEAIEHNYGGIDDEMTINAKHCSNAYMLVYIRVSEIPKILENINNADIPSELIERLTEEKRMEQVRRRERSEANTYVFIHVILEEYFDGHQSTDLFDNEKIHPRVFKLKKTQTIGDLMQVFFETFKYDVKRMRIWPLVTRFQLTRPVYFDINEEFNRNLQHVIETQSPWTIYLQLASPDHIGPLPPFEKNRDILLFFKFYDPIYKRLNYVGSNQYQLAMKLCDLVPILNKELGFQPNTELTIYEEQGPNVVAKITNLQEPIEKGLKLSNRSEDVHGNVLIFERKHQDEKLELPTCDDYFRDLLYRIEVTFVDKCNPNDSGFTLELSHRNTYDQMAQAVAQKINTDPNKIQFFKCLGYKDQPGNPLRCIYDGSLKDLLSYNKPRTIKKVFYQRLSMSINELENKKQFKCLYLSLNLKDEKDLVLYPNKNGTIKNLLEEAAKQIDFSEDSTRKLRLLEVSSHKIFPPLREDTLLELLQCVSDTMTNQSSQKCYRIEEIPRDELVINDNEMLIPISHFSKEIYNSFGVPFYIKAKQNEPFGAVKERIQKKLNVPDKEFEKYKFVIVSMGRIEYFQDDNTLVNLENFKPSATQAAGTPLPYLGLDHINKSQKRSRYTYLEKAIKIYN